MAQRTGTSVSTHNPTLVHCSGRDGSYNRSTPSLVSPPPTPQHQGLVLMKPDLSPHYQWDIPCLPPTPACEGESGMVTLLCPFQTPWDQGGARIPCGGLPAAEKDS